MDNQQRKVIKTTQGYWSLLYQ